MNLKISIMCFLWRLSVQHPLSSLPTMSALQSLQLGEIWAFKRSQFGSFFRTEWQINLCCEKQTAEVMAIASRGPTCLVNNMHFAYRANKRKASSCHDRTPSAKNNDRKQQLFSIYGRIALETHCNSNIKGNEAVVFVLWQRYWRGTQKHTQFIQQRLIFSCLFLSAAAVSASCSHDQHPQLSEA